MNITNLRTCCGEDRSLIYVAAFNTVNELIGYETCDISIQAL